MLILKQHANTGNSNPKMEVLLLFFFPFQKALIELKR